MTDDLGRRLEDLATRVGEGKPDLGAVVARGKRTRMARSAGAAIGAVAVTAAATFAVFNFDVGNEVSPAPPAHHDDGDFVPAEPGEPTYALTNFRIEYPWAKVDSMPGLRPGSEKRELYCSTPEREEECQSEGNAGFFYEWHWATGQFPGIVACRVELFAASGRKVGHQDWELSGLEPRSRMASDVWVHVTGKPTRAEASCEAGTVPDGPTHRFTFVREEGDQLFFEVETLTEHGSGMCELRVTFESGYETTSSFTMTGGPREGELFEIGAPPRPGDPVADASITCEALRGPQDDEVEFVPYPGVQWYGPDGEEIPFETNIINAITGPDHCKWQSGVMMHVGWPLGHDADNISESRQYFRDPEGVFPQEGFMTTFDGDVELPRRAESTGYRTDFMELWLVPGDGTAAYLVFSDHTERWPRSNEVIACA